MAPFLIIYDGKIWDIHIFKLILGRNVKIEVKCRTFNQQ